MQGKGTFNIPDEDNQTENDSTDANGQELVYTGISTIHKFTKTGKAARAVTVNTGLEKIANESTFFNSVQTPDTIEAKTITPSVSVVPSRLELVVGDIASLEAIVAPVGTTVTWSSSASSVASVADGIVSAESAGSATITASITVDGNTYTDTCAVTVTAAE